MSRLILTGDTNANFGKLIPTPYISQIYVSDDGEGESSATDLGEIDVVIDIYVRSDEYSDDITLINQIKDFRFYWHVATTNKDHNSGTWQDWSIDDLIDQKYSIWSIFGPGPDDDNDYTGWNGGAPSTPEAGYFTIANLTTEDVIDYEVIYDDEGNRVLKFVYSSLSRGGTVTLEKESERLGHNMKLDGSGETGDIYLFAWCLPVEPVGDLSGEPDSDYDDNWGRLLDLQTGDIAYELIWTDEAPATTDEVTWVDGDGNAYEGTPLQSISSQYYSVDRITHADIVSSFQDILDAYESLAEDDDPLQDMLDQVSYVLAIYALKADLLSQLNLVRRVFPSKSSVTNVGQFYITYRDAIYNTNTVVETGTILTKKEVTNAKVIDNRDVSLTWVETPTYDGDVDRLEDEYPTDEGTDYNFVSNLTIGKEELSDDTGTRVGFCNYGFVFFDYNRALYESAAIGEYLNMGILISVLGVDIFKKYFTLYKTQFQRRTSSSWVMYMITEYDDGYTPTDIKHVTNSSYTDYCPPYLSDGEDCFAYSFVLLRNLELASEGWWDDYPMMCFEIQEFLSESASVRSGTEYDLRFYVYIEDNTLSIISDLISAYADAIGDTDSGLTEYVATATADCVFSTLDDMWVDSFIEEMHATYDDDIGNAPWIYYPVFYAIHKELLTKEHGGDLTAVQMEAQDISAKINPDTGTVAELETFFDAFVTLYGEHYEPTGDGTLSDYADTSAIEKKFYQTWEESEGAPGAPGYSGYEEFIAAYDGDETICEGAQYAVSAESVEGYRDESRDFSPYEYTPDDGDTDVALDSNPVVKYLGYGSSAESIYIGTTELADGDDVSDYYIMYPDDGVGANIGMTALVSIGITTTGITIYPTHDLDPEMVYYLASDYGGNWNDGEGGLAIDWSISFTTEAESSSGGAGTAPSRI
jgi:hypothetical protein